MGRGRVLDLPRIATFMVADVPSSEKSAVVEPAEPMTEMRMA